MKNIKIAVVAITCPVWILILLVIVFVGEVWGVSKDFYETFIEN